jgi:hypothetical protein
VIRVTTEHGAAGRRFLGGPHLQLCPLAEPQGAGNLATRPVGGVFLWGSLSYPFPPMGLEGLACGPPRLLS